jgi:hypothetical protein
VDACMLTLYLPVLLRHLSVFMPAAKQLPPASTTQPSHPPG